MIKKYLNVSTEVEVRQKLKKFWSTHGCSSLCNSCLIIIIIMASVFCHRYVLFDDSAGIFCT